MKLWLNCQEASRSLSEGMDRELGLIERGSLRVHLMMCVACGRVERQFGFLRRAAQAYPGPQDDGAAAPAGERPATPRKD